MPVNIYFSFFIISSLFNLSLLQKRRLTEEEKSEDIIILHTNDVHCGIDNNIGYDGLMLYKKELKEQYNNVILVDIGDHVQGGILGFLSQGTDIIDIMNEIYYDVVTIGNHEVDYGVEQLKELSNLLSNGDGYICANFLLRGENPKIFEPYKVIQAGGKKIGFIGVTTPQTLTKSYLNYLYNEDGKQKYDFLTENEGEELSNKIQEYINYLRDNEGVNYVILLTHMGTTGDPIFTSDKLLSKLSNVDAVLDGHTHQVYNQTYKDKDNKDVYIIQTGVKLANIGKLTIKTDGTIISEIISDIPEPDITLSDVGIEVDRNGRKRWVDRTMNEYIKNKINSHQSKYDEIIGFSNFDLIAKYETGEQLSLKNENILGNLIADSIRHLGNGEITLVSSSKILDNILKGDISYGNILKVLPLDNEIKVKEVTGSVILDALEFGMRLLPNENPSFCQVSGIKFKVDETIKSSVKVDAKGFFIKVEGERRVYDVYVGNEKLDENKNYTLAIDNYISEGGDGYMMFNKIIIKTHTRKVDNEALKEYINNFKNNIIPDEYRNTQERIVKQKKENSGNFIQCFKKFISLLLFLML